MKPSQKYNIGITIAVMGSVVGILLIKFFKVDIWLTCYIGSAITLAGLDLISKSTQQVVSIQQGRVYRLINITKSTDTEETETVFVTFMYKNAYGNDQVHTFTGLNFVTPIDEKNIGNDFVAYSEKETKKLVFKPVV